MKNKILLFFMALTLVFGGYDIACAQSTPAKTQAVKTTPAKAPSSATKAQNTNYISVAPLDVVKNPSAYLNKNVKMKAVFDKFSTLGLDYKPAMKSSADYIGYLIRRDDVTDHVIPLSEMKLFIKRDAAQKFIDLESGDIIEIEGKVFSCALGDPWIETVKLTVLEKKAKKDKK